ncbi:uncharacterized protein [Spinacia oleracea]|uniref:Uncharacterized protein isoform X2 n=1 Tax=Spinacia oleracea TaxID=3562 RepID=A0A9R0JEX5_SPIOL|nr:uncharacterized protein LOC110805383 isoform X2 [Spinacia oleracea]
MKVVQQHMAPLSIMSKQETADTKTLKKKKKNEHFSSISCSILVWYLRNSHGTFNPPLKSKFSQYPLNCGRLQAFSLSPGP